jgi:uncharacterized protein
MDAQQAALVAAAGVGAGALNAVVGGGTLLSFPALLALGLPPVSANVTSSLGVTPGSVAGAYAYRHQLGPLRPVLRPAAVAAVLGSAGGAILLLELPAKVFDAVVPVLLVAAAVLVAVQPRVSRWVDRRRPVRAPGEPHAPSAVVTGAVLVVSVYGGYFGAGVSVMYLAVLGALLGGLQRSNGAKNVLSACCGLAAAVVFALRAPVDWAAVVILAAGAAVGGLVGGRYGRRLPDTWLRAFVVVLALVVAVRQAFFA